MSDTLEPRRSARLTAGDSKTLRVRTTLDLSGTDVRYVVAPERGGDAIITKTSDGSGVTITDATDADGDDIFVFEVYLNGDDTKDLRGGYWHEAQAADSDGNGTTIFTGDFVVRPDTA